MSVPGMLESEEYHLPRILAVAGLEVCSVHTSDQIERPVVCSKVGDLVD